MKINQFSVYCKCFCGLCVMHIVHLWLKIILVYLYAINLLLQVPTLIVQGSKDIPMGSTASQHLSALPNSYLHIMEGGGHPCYLDNPKEWHCLLYNFLEALTKWHAMLSTMFKNNWCRCCARNIANNTATTANYFISILLPRTIT